MDKPTTDFYGDKSMDYVLAIANMANRLYADKSVGFPLVFCLTKVFLIESNLPALDIVKNKIDSASRYLHVFSKWFQTVNTPEGSAEHFDNAVMLTRETCGINKCTLDGLAYFGSPCSSSLGASVNDAYGLATAFSVAHEVAHNFGVDHDFGTCSNGHIMSAGQSTGATAFKWSACSRKTLMEVFSFGVDHDFGTCSNGHIMSAGQSTGATAFKWSACSRKTLMEVFSRVKCYDNRPPTNITLPSLPPGHEFDGDEQCRIVYGQEYKLCSVTTGNCGTLFCMRGSSCVNTRGMPPVDGTPCGHRKWCISGHCEDVGDSYPMAVDGAWGAWGDYSTCSRTCGGGVRHRSRRCDNPKPQYGGKDCPGSPKGKWRICNAQAGVIMQDTLYQRTFSYPLGNDCPPGTESYRKTQCVAINSVYTNYYNTPDRCSLWCREGSSAVREGQVADGTRYDEDDPDIRDICIAGERVVSGIFKILVARNRISST
ncbi:predicted protein [Nematostella vectensis]|uniref:Peptidase M12B domain-containing protein n=1 Tax=Nematostella vectensis TaxID=45351 RepID=A7T5R3_NEMVE|nr:predicted protein [Nematostella vectensis]|eukprot:XP_001620798.1 hypothetical protein NEMVEDRAFT_v1g222694 [Nematostella vectensis]